MSQCSRSMMVQAFADLLVANHGRIVNVSSSASVINSPWVSTYATSKAALNTLSETMRLELAPFGVSVVTILPGVIDSNLHVNDATSFDIPPTSRYVAIKSIIASWATGEAQPKDSLSAEKFAELVMDDILGTGKGGLVSRGPYATLLKCIGQWAPSWLASKSRTQRAIAINITRPSTRAKPLQRDRDGTGIRSADLQMMMLFNAGDGEVGDGLAFSRLRA
ncbi:hypothetical protein CHU98_g8508 [Xylaria longipes]|nr:hypothetical protein CHU98_g8508 [Xylaria longipes]